MIHRDVNNGDGMPPRRIGGPIRVFVVDDHPAVCAALECAFEAEQDLFYCGAAHTAESARRSIAQANPDVIVLDLTLGDAFGLLLVSELRERVPHARVLIYSMVHEGAYAERAIRLGASGYVCKTERTDAVLEAIRAVFEGRVYLNKRIALRLVSEIIRGESRVKDKLDCLTNQELAVAHLLGAGYKSQKIAEVLQLNGRTVQAYMRRAKHKLGCHTSGELLKQAVHWTGNEAVQVVK